MVKYEDVKHQTTEEYFNNNQFSIDAFNKKYAHIKTDGTLETYVDALHRICTYIASAEKTDKLKEQWYRIWFDEIYNNYWQPAGSIMQGAGSSEKISLENCTHIGLPHDSLECLFSYTEYRIAKVAAYRQGLGIHYDKIRPAKAKVNNSSKESQGTLHWMKKHDNTGYYIGQKGRVPAMLMSLGIKHPDAPEFISSKSDYTKIQNANISIQITNDFYEAVYNNIDWNMEFIIPEIKKGQKLYLDNAWDDIRLADGVDEVGHYAIAKFDRVEERIERTENARTLLKLISECMFSFAEPGIQNIDIARKYSNSDVVGFPIIGTNACCVVEDTNVLTDIGVLKIKDVFDRINSGEKILAMSYNIVDDKYELKPILNAWQQRNDTTICIKICDGEYVHSIECSSDHPVLTKNRGYVKAENLSNTDEIVVGNIIVNKPSTATLVEINIKNEIKPLYDIEVEGNNNFIANNIVVHNSEQYLDNLGACNLASIFCGKFYNSENKYDTNKLKIIAKSINRFLDNVVEMELKDGRYAVYEQKHSLESLRRTGAGLTDIVSLLFQNNIEYGSIDSNELMEKFVDDYNYYLYKASIELGKEKGSFKAFDKSKYITSGFIKNMMERHPDLEFDTMRNVCVGSIAPTGTLSLMNRYSVLSYGIEPSFGMYYWKRTRISGKYEYYFVLPKIVRDLFESKGVKLDMESDTIKDTWDGSIGKRYVDIIEKNKDKLGINFKNASEIKVNDKLDLMAKIQKYIDSSISVTYLLPETSTSADVYDFILKAYEYDLKSIAAFPDKKMYGIVSYIPFKELALKLKSEKVEMHIQNFSDIECAELNLSEIKHSDNLKATKRPIELDADIYSISVKNEKYCIAIGLLNGKPYEIFGGLMNGLAFKFSHKTGKIIKESRGKYRLEIGDLIVEDFAEQFKPAEQALFRMVSTLLRHNVPMKFIVEQLQKSTDDMFSLPSAASRVLKKYIKDGEKAHGQKCPVCNSSDLIYAEGCITCMCGWSKCA